MRNMTDIKGKLMSGDNAAATVKNGIITDYNKLLLPLYLKRTKDVEKWLAYRAVDHSRKMHACSKEPCGCAQLMMCRQRLQ